MVRAIFDFLALAIMRQFVIYGTLDLTNELFEKFLDPRRQYSCAYFHRPDDSLETAQETKLARLAAELNLRPGHRVLDIGCGWGGLAMAMTECRENLSVTGITLSCLLYTSPSPRDTALSRMPSSA